VAPLFAEPALGVRSSRSYVDLPTNAGFIARLSARNNLGAFLSGRLPADLLPAFLHEATHHWCFHSSLGFTIAAIYQRAAANAAIISDAAHGHGHLSVSPQGAGFAEFESAFQDLLRFETAFRVLMPFIEGLALFAEFDVQPQLQDVTPMPFGLATRIFAGPNASDRAESWNTLSGRIAEARASSAMADRKYQVLLKGLAPSREPYCAGYLSVKSAWSAAATYRSELRDSGAFLTFLRNFIFEDLGLADILLRGKIENSGRVVPFGGEFATRLRDRVRSLYTRDAYSGFDEYLATLKKVVDAPHAPDSPLPPQLSLLDAKTADDGWNAIQEVLDEFEARGKSSDGGAVAWASMQATLNERYVQILDISDVYVRVSRAGICSIWQDPAASTPLLAGARCLVESQHGKEGPGHVVLLLSTHDAVAFFAVLLDGHIVFDTLSADYSEPTLERLRRAIGNIPVKLQLSDNIDALLTAFFRRGEDPRHALATNLDQVVDEIYLGQALPWLSKAQRDQVAPKLAQSGLGLAALLPRGKRHLFKILVTWSLGASPADEEIDTFLAEAGEEESLSDLLNRINEMAISVWGRDVIYMEDGEIRAILF
jgi:hypothetical protein